MPRRTVSVYALFFSSAFWGFFRPQNPKTINKNKYLTKGKSEKVSTGPLTDRQGINDLYMCRRHFYCLLFRYMYIIYIMWTLLIDDGSVVVVVVVVVRFCRLCLTYFPVSLSLCLFFVFFLLSRTRGRFRCSSRCTVLPTGSTRSCSTRWCSRRTPSSGETCYKAYVLGYGFHITPPPLSNYI